MGFFDRVARILKSNINDLISKAEDPHKILDQLIIDMRQQLQESRKQVAMSIADEKRLKKQLNDELMNTQAWERKAMRAVQMGDDELAKEALGRKANHDKLAAEYQKQWEMQKAAVDKLKGMLQLLNNKMEEAARKKNILIARQKRAEAQKKIQQVMSGVSDNSAFDALDRITQKVDQMEAEAEAQAELDTEWAGASLEDRFRALETGPDAQDEALAALKAKMGMASGEPEQVKVKERVAERVPVGRDDDGW